MTLERTTERPRHVNSPGVAEVSPLRWLLDRLEGYANVPFRICLHDGTQYTVGGATNHAFDLIIESDAGLAALKSLDEIRIAEAYMAGDLEIRGELLEALCLRHALRNRHPVLDFLRKLRVFAFGQTAEDRCAISTHYEYDDDFYHLILDETRTYSQGIYRSDDESLETAMRRKLDYAIEACRLRPGMRVLDVGGGWGAFTEYAGRRGISVTSLTISDSSYRYLSNLIEEKHLPCDVRLENFLDIDDSEAYNAVVILGVIEHLPNYARVVRQLERVLKPNGVAYLDGSAARTKFDFNLFVNRYIYPGNHCMWSIHDFLTEVQSSALEILDVHNDRYSYYLTICGWARNLEAQREEIIRRWGRALYCKFHLYLWGVAHNFLTNQLQAYRLVVRLNPAS